MQTAAESATFRKEFDRVAAGARAMGDRDAAARIELCREYFLNPAFRKEMEAFVWSIAEREG